MKGEFLKSVSADALLELESVATFSSCAQGTLLFIEGQGPQKVYILLQGEVKLSIGITSGKGLTVHIAGPGDVLGLAAAFTGEEHHTTATALRPCRFAAVPCSVFLSFLSTYPQVSRAAMRQLGLSCERAYTRLRTIGATTSNRAKLARLTLEWMKCGKQTERGTQIHVPLKHGEIAEYIGTCRESIGRALQDFQRSRVIEVHGAVWIILDRVALEQCAGVCSFQTEP
jgi:CRP/FNR family transcriptional regulator, cyclic AMP receptor protein